MIANKYHMIANLYNLVVCNASNANMLARLYLNLNEVPI